MEASQAGQDKHAERQQDGAANHERAAADPVDKVERQHRGQTVDHVEVDQDLKAVGDANGLQEDDRVGDDEAAALRLLQALDAGRDEGAAQVGAHENVGPGRVQVELAVLLLGLYQEIELLVDESDGRAATEKVEDPARLLDLAPADEPSGRFREEETSGDKYDRDDELDHERGTVGPLVGAGLKTPVGDTGHGRSYELPFSGKFY